MSISCNRGCSNLFWFLRQSSNNGLWILSLIFLLFRATMAYLYALISSPNTVDCFPALWGRGSSPLIRLPSFSLMQLFACLESHVVYYTILMSLHCCILDQSVVNSWDSGGSVKHLPSPNGWLDRMLESDRGIGCLLLES